MTPQATNDRCPTKSGAYQCAAHAGHKGPCEAQAPEYATGKQVALMPPKRAKGEVQLGT